MVRLEKEILNGDAVQAQLYTIETDGSIEVSNIFKKIKGDYPLLLRMGTDIQMPAEMNQLQWYGRGPGESYWDRKNASLVGIYRQTTDEQYFSYARPQESGNKADVRWVNITNKKGLGIAITYTDSLLNFSALPYSLDDLDPEMEKKQYHSGELKKRDKIFLHVDLQQTGVQGIDSWGAWPLKKYRLPYGDHSFSFRIVPLK